MSISLEPLEHKVDQVLALCASLRGENEALRVHVAGLEADKAALKAKIDATCRRLESLLERLPEE